MQMEPHRDDGFGRPKLWGPYLWRALHLVALGYPTRPSDAERAAYRAFYENIAHVLPCATCAANYRRHLQEDLPLEPGLLDGGHDGALFAWTVRLHNLVNAELGAPRADWTPEQARRALMLPLPLPLPQLSSLQSSGPASGRRSSPAQPPSTAVLLCFAVLFAVAVIACAILLSRH
jgi:hypothetical protein